MAMNIYPGGAYIVASRKPREVTPEAMPMAASAPAPKKRGKKNGEER